MPSPTGPRRRGEWPPDSPASYHDSSYVYTHYQKHFTYLAVNSIAWSQTCPQPTKGTFLRYRGHGSAHSALSSCQEAFTVRLRILYDSKRPDWLPVLPFQQCRKLQKAKDRIMYLLYIYCMYIMQGSPDFSVWGPHCIFYIQIERKSPPESPSYSRVLIKSLFISDSP